MCKHFFSAKFKLLLNFNCTGLASGYLYPYAKCPFISEEISGLCCMIDQNICLSFSCTFSNPNINTETHTTFSGEIIKYDNEKECLILKWLMFQDLINHKLIDSGTQILFDNKYRNEEIEMRKVQLYLKEHALQLEGARSPVY